MKKNGFTLIELLVIIAIIAMVLGLLVPALIHVKNYATGNTPENRIESLELLEINDNNALGTVGKSYKIPIFPSLSGRESFKIYVRNLPREATLEFYDGSYYIVWKPIKQVKKEVVIITAGTNIKDEVKILMEAY